MTTIARVTAREVLDSRGNPTVEADVVLSDGSLGRAIVPSGASTGSREAVELRDGDPKRFRGLGVLRAVENVRGPIAGSLEGRRLLEQRELDSVLKRLDGTDNKSKLGANAILGVSLAYAHATAASKKVPLYRHLSVGGEPALPVPMFNIINGGKHALDSTDIQEFMVIPAGFDRFSEALRAGAEVYGALRRLLRHSGHRTTVGDEGGFSPTLQSNQRAVELVVEAIEAAGYKAGTECFVGLDVAASEVWTPNLRYNLASENKSLTGAEMMALYETWAHEFHVISIEDGMPETDWKSWQDLTAKMGGKTQLVGDDLLVTDPKLITQAIQQKAANAALIKLNQIGTVTETLEAIRTAKDASWGVVVSHRSGETEDTSIADLAVGTAAGQVKAGAPARGERTAKYNRLLRIEEELGPKAQFAGRNVYERFLRNRR
ncbi:MAG: phosphopyruvate hydratase [SAR202 cluster bacterium]|nr:phosphopyruvate hydratase [SAR202 cluster bacterium]